MSKYCNFPPKNNSNHKQSKLIFFFNISANMVKFSSPTGQFPINPSYG